MAKGGKGGKKKGKKNKGGGFPPIPCMKYIDLEFYNLETAALNKKLDLYNFTINEGTADLDEEIEHLVYGRDDELGNKAEEYKTQMNKLEEIEVEHKVMINKVENEIFMHKEALTKMDYEVEQVKEETSMECRHLKVKLAILDHFQNDKDNFGKSYKVAEEEFKGFEQHHLDRLAEMDRNYRSFGFRTKASIEDKLVQISKEFYEEADREILPSTNRLLRENARIETSVNFMHNFRREMYNLLNEQKNQRYLQGILLRQHKSENNYLIRKNAQQVEAIRKMVSEIEEAKVSTKRNRCLNRRADEMRKKLAKAKEQLSKTRISNTEIRHKFECLRIEFDDVTAKKRKLIQTIQRYMKSLRFLEFHTRMIGTVEFNVPCHKTRFDDENFFVHLLRYLKTDLLTIINAAFIPFGRDSVQTLVQRESDILKEIQKMPEIDNIPISDKEPTPPKSLESTEIQLTRIESEESVKIREGMDIVDIETDEEEFILEAEADQNEVDEEEHEGGEEDEEDYSSSDDEAPPQRDSKQVPTDRREPIEVNDEPSVNALAEKVRPGLSLIVEGTKPDELDELRRKSQVTSINRSHLASSIQQLTIQEDEIEREPNHET